MLSIHCITYSLNDFLSDMNNDQKYWLVDMVPGLNLKFIFTEIFLVSY